MEWEFRKFLWDGKFPKLGKFPNLGKVPNPGNFLGNPAWEIPRKEKLEAIRAGRNGNFSLNIPASNRGTGVQVPYGCTYS